MANSPKFSQIRTSAHDDGIELVRFSPDGNRLLSLGWHGTVKLWDFRQPTFWNKRAINCAQEIAQETGKFRGCSVTPDGRFVVLHRAESTHVWDASGGRWHFELEDETFRLLTRDGNLLITEGPWNTGLRLRDMNNGKVLAAIDLDAGKIRPSYNPAMDDMTDEEIEVHTPNALIAHISEVDEGQLIVSYENHKTFTVSLVTHEVEGPTPYIVKALHPNGRTAFARESSPHLTAFDLFNTDIKPIRLDDAVETYGIGRIAFLANGNMVTTNDNAARIWQNETWTCLRTIPIANEKETGTNPRDSRINALTVLGDGARVATASDSDRPRIWNGATGASVEVEGSESEVVGARQLVGHPEGLIGMVAGGLRLWDDQSGAVKFSIDEAGPAFDVAPDGTFAVGDETDLVIVKPGG